MQKRIASALLMLFAILGVFEGFLAVRASIRDKDSDIGRQWTTLQYVLRGVNPYPVALDALRTTYGELAPKGAVHLRDIRIFNIPRSGPHPDTITALGPPEVTYPPTTMISMLPVAFMNVAMLRAMWLALNVLLIALVARELSLFIGVTGFCECSDAGRGCSVATGSVMSETPTILVVGVVGDSGR